MKRNDAKICGNGSGFASGNQIMINERCKTGAPHSGTEQMRITAFHLNTYRYNRSVPAATGPAAAEAGEATAAGPPQVRPSRCPRLPVSSAHYNQG
jgi:hypothetical protein